MNDLLRGKNAIHVSGTDATALRMHELEAQVTDLNRQINALVGDVQVQTARLAACRDERDRMETERNLALAERDHKQRSIELICHVAQELKDPTAWELIVDILD